MLFSLCCVHFSSSFCISTQYTFQKANLLAFPERGQYLRDRKTHERTWEKCSRNGREHERNAYNINSCPEVSTEFLKLWFTVAFIIFLSVVKSTTDGWWKKTLVSKFSLNPLLHVLTVYWNEFCDAMKRMLHSGTILVLQTLISTVQNRIQSYSEPFS